MTIKSLKFSEILRPTIGLIDPGSFRTITAILGRSQYLGILQLSTPYPWTSSMDTLTVIKEFQNSHHLVVGGVLLPHLNFFV